MCDVDQSTLNKVLKDVAVAVGDVNALVAASHGFRRGFACDLALAGAQLVEILDRLLVLQGWIAPLVGRLDLQ